MVAERLNTTHENRLHSQQHITILHMVPVVMW